MKKHYESMVKGGGNSYSSPSIEIMSISIEKGFADSIVLDYSAPGAAGNLEEGNSYDF